MNSARIFDDHKSSYSNTTIDKEKWTKVLPFYGVYTKMTGVGDAGAWYHSKIVYTLTPNEKIFLGEEIQLYSGSKPNNNTHIRQVECNVKTVTGDGNGDEEIYTITLPPYRSRYMAATISTGSKHWYVCNLNSRLIVVLRSTTCSTGSSKLS